MDDLQGILSAWSKIDRRDDNEAMRSNLLVVPILTKVLGWQPNELLSERTLKIEVPDLQYGPRVLRKRPDFILLPSGFPRHHVFGVVEAKEKKSTLARLLGFRKQVHGYQSLLAALWGVLTDGERWAIFHGREMVDFFTGFDDLTTRVDAFAKLLHRTAADRHWRKDPATGLTLLVASNVLLPDAWPAKQVALGTSFQDYLKRTSWDSVTVTKSTSSQLRERTYTAFVDFSRRRVEPWGYLRTLLSLYEDGGKALFGSRINVLWSQVAWPMLVRLHTLPSMFQGVVIDQTKDESAVLLKRMRSKGVKCDALDHICSRIESVKGVENYRPAEFNMRTALETVVKVCEPSGFKFSDYPAFARWCGWDTLWNEIEESEVCVELDYATRKALCVLDGKPPPELSAKEKFAQQVANELAKRQQ